MLAAPWIAAVALLIRSGVESTGGVPAALTSRLTTGVNIARWFCYCSPDDTNRFRSYLTDGDLVELRRLKIGFVRLCVAPTTIDNDGTPNAANLPYLDAAIDRLESAGLAVILDLHDTHGHLGFDQPGHDNSSLARFWTAMATHYKGRQETSLVFEILNEPIFRDNPEVWDGLQRQTVDAIRAADPERTIMVTSTRYDGIDTLAKMTPRPWPTSSIPSIATTRLSLPTKARPGRASSTR